MSLVLFIITMVGVLALAVWQVNAASKMFDEFAALYSELAEIESRLKKLEKK